MAASTKYYFRKLKVWVENQIWLIFTVDKTSIILNGSDKIGKHSPLCILDVDERLVSLLSKKISQFSYCKSWPKKSSADSEGVFIFA